MILKLKPTVAEPTPGAKLASPIQRKVSKAMVVGWLSQPATPVAIDHNQPEISGIPASTWATHISIRLAFKTDSISVS